MPRLDSCGLRHARTTSPHLTRAVAEPGASVHEPSACAAITQASSPPWPPHQAWPPLAALSFRRRRGEKWPDPDATSPDPDTTSPDLPSPAWIKHSKPRRRSGGYWHGRYGRGVALPSRSQHRRPHRHRPRGRTGFRLHGQAAARRDVGRRCVSGSGARSLPVSSESDAGPKRWSCVLLPKVLLYLWMVHAAYQEKNSN
jgi:hypothetical protein